MILNLLNTLGSSLKGKVWGIRLWPKGSENGEITRLTPNNDPLYYVNTTSISSTDLPWNGMEDYNIPSTGEPTLVSNAPTEYYASGSNIYVKIPKFYFLCHSTSGYGYLDLYISDTDNSAYGFIPHPGSDRYISKYPLTSDGYSRGKDGRSGSPQNTGRNSQNLTRAQIINISQTLSNTYGQFYQLDFATYSAILLLFMFEYCSYYWTGGFTAIDSITNPGLNGHTNSINEHTGQTEGHSKYRNIEDFYQPYYSTPIIGIEADNNLSLHIYDNPASNEYHTVNITNSNISPISLIYTFSDGSTDKLFNQWYWYFPYVPDNSNITYKTAIGYFLYTPNQNTNFFWTADSPAYDQLFTLIARTSTDSDDYRIARGIYIPN